MGLHFIKNGTKKAVCVKRPSLFPASATTYDNSQSGLSATRVQGAIDEINAKVDRGSVSVVATDSQQTFGNLFHELSTLIDTSKITTGSTLVLGTDDVYHLTHIPNLIFVRTGVGASSRYITSAQLVPSKYYNWNGSTYTDQTSYTPGAGFKLTVFY